MFDIYFVVFILFFSAGCLIEFFVFNEEILLSLCFLSFIFFAFNTMSDSVYDNFTSAASKLESDLLVSYNSLKQSFTIKFEYFFQMRGLNSKFKILLASIKFYLSISQTSSASKLSSSFFSIAFSKLNELVLFENKLFLSFQQNCVTTLLYPLIFQTANTKAYLTSSLFRSVQITTPTKVSKALKMFSL